MITTLRSRVGARAAPPVLHLDNINLQEEPPNGAPSPPPSPGTPVQSHQLSSSQDSPQQWSLLAALTEEILKFQGDGVTGDALQSETSSSAPADRRQTTNSENLIFVGNRERTDSKSLATPIGQLAAEATADPKQAVRSLKTRSPHRSYRSLLYKRQIPGASGKSKHYTLKPVQKVSLTYLYKLIPELNSLPFGQNFNHLTFFIPTVCPGVRESSLQVTQVRDSYRWILNIPSKNLRMNFQEVH